MKSLCLSLLFIVSFDAYSSQSIGLYNNGKLEDAINITDINARLHKLYIKRNRLYTSRLMFETLETLAFDLELDYPNAEALQIGDLSNKFGGKANGHSSHQNGLDADISYLRNNHYIQSPLTRNWDESFVYKGKVTSNFNLDANWVMFTKLVQTKNVRRIFVDRAIKNAYCDKRKTLFKKYDKEEVNEVLRRLRPSKGHNNHLHVRLGCPTNNWNCIEQAEPVKGTACKSTKYSFRKRSNKVKTLNKKLL